MTTKAAGCFDKPCKPWEQPEDCCDLCEDEDNQALYDMWWEAVTEWLYVETCGRYPGCCPVEVEPCPPCECKCLNYCGCGPLATLDLGEAFCDPVCVEDKKPCLELVFPQADGSEVLIGPDDGVWTLRPDLHTLDFCQPLPSDSCSGFWPGQDHCGKPWTIRATIGCEPPKMLALGAAKFVCEIVKDCLGKDSCLPDGVRSITRRGLTMDVGPQFEETINFDNKGTGVPALDFALRTYGDCGDQFHVFDPLAKLHKEHQRVWSFRGVLCPELVSFC